MNYGPTPSTATPQPLYARFRHGTHTVDFTPDPAVNYHGNGVGNGVAFGDVVIIGALAGVALVPLPASIPGALCIEGMFDFPKSGSDAGLTSGALAYWDNTAFVATSTASGNTYLGKVNPPGTLTADTIVQISMDTISNASGSIGFGTQPSGTVAAAGTNYATGGVLVPGINVVTGADSTKGVALPATPAAGTIVIVKNNTSGQTLPVYPDGAATVNAVAAHGAIAMASLTSALFFATSATQWFTLPLLPS